VYEGYHRDQTLSVIKKYISPEPPEGMGCDETQPEGEAKNEPLKESLAKFNPEAEVFMETSP
jgi:hypothetical protein